MRRSYHACAVLKRSGTAMISIFVSLEKVISNGPWLRKLMARKGNCNVGELSLLQLHRAEIRRTFMNTNLKCLMTAAAIVIFGTPALVANHVKQRHVRASQAPYQRCKTP
jgi:hypothetical protein